MYVSHVLKLRADGYDVQLEQRVSPNAIFFPDAAPIDLFGTADCIAWHRANRHLEIVDLKYGRGVTVDARDNAQFLYYALGVLLTTGYDPVEVTTTVVQPRPSRRRADPPRHLCGRGRAHVGPVGPQDRGPPRARRRRATEPWIALQVLPCPWHVPDVHKQALVVAQSQFSPAPLSPPVPASLTNAELADIVMKLDDVFENWSTAIRQEAYNRLVNGEEIPGFKLVQKRAMRKWAEDADPVFIAEAPPAWPATTTPMCSSAAGCAARRRSRSWSASGACAAWTSTSSKKAAAPPWSATATIVRPCRAGSLQPPCSLRWRRHEVTHGPCGLRTPSDQGAT